MSEIFFEQIVNYSTTKNLGKDEINDRVITVIIKSLERERVNKKKSIFPARPPVMIPLHRDTAGAAKVIKSVLMFLL